MMPEVTPAGLAKASWWEHVVRFAFGGAITVATGAIAKVWGPAIAGLFLAFPAILPASITLVKRHDGRRQATEDARGARLGSVGLLGFAAVVLLGAGRLPAPVVLAIAALAWVTTAVALWFWRCSRPGR